MPEVEKSVLFGLREELQTPKGIYLPSHFMDGSLAAPCDIRVGEVLGYIQEMADFPQVRMEIGNPSCPMTTYEGRMFTDAGKSLGIGDRVAMHARVIDFKQVVKVCGAESVHLFDNLSGAHNNRQTVDGLISLVDKNVNGGGSLKNLRISLEHATRTNPEIVRSFIAGMGDINRRRGRQVITGIGLPDTTGFATPEDYMSLLDFLIPDIRELHFEVFMHLHDDGGRALETAQFLAGYLSEQEIPWVVETVQPLFPGERVGIRPYITELDAFGVKVPEGYEQMLKGASWKSQTFDGWDQDSVRKAVRSTHVAGLHGSDMKSYNGDGDNIPHPGLYSIMGASNIIYLWRRLGLVKADEKIPAVLKDVAKATAQVGRELAGQKGNQEQRYAIALAQEAFEYQKFMVDTAFGFGEPHTWLKKEIPNLSELWNSIEKRVDTSRHY